MVNGEEGAPDGQHRLGCPATSVLAEPELHKGFQRTKRTFQDPPVGVPCLEP